MFNERLAIFVSFLSFSLAIFAQNPAGRITSDQTICYGTAPQILTFVDQPYGGSTSYSYTWERSNDGINYKIIAGSTSARNFFYPPVLGRTAWFRCRVTDSSNTSLGTTDPVIITVHTELIAGEIGAKNQIVNYGSRPELITHVSPVSGGSGSNLIFRWQSSEDGLYWTDISNISADYSPPQLFNTTYYRRWVNDPVCGSTVSNTVTIYVNTNNLHYDFTYPDRSSLELDGWDFIARHPSGGGLRDTEVTDSIVVSFDQQLHPGVIRIPLNTGSLWGTFNSNNTCNTLFKDLPINWVSIRLKIASFAPVQDTEYAGLVAYQDDDNYVQITRDYNLGNQVVFISEVNGYARHISVEENTTTDLYFRIDRDLTTDVISTYYSLNGFDWIFVGDEIRILNLPRLGIVTGESRTPGFPTADIEWAEIYTDILNPIYDTLSIHPSSLVFNAVEGQILNTKQNIYISTITGRTVRWDQTTDASWLTTDLINGMTEGVLPVGVNTNIMEMEVGIHKGKITIDSEQVTGAPISVDVTLIVNPSIPVKASTWKDGKSGAMSISVDDGEGSGYNELLNNGFQGTYVCNYTQPPSFYTEYYLNGMELGAHTTNHIYLYIPNNNDLRYQEYEPNINGICNNTPQSCDDVITLVWPFGVTNYRAQAVAAEYFLSSRGYNINQLEDATPENFMNLKSFNSLDDALQPYTGDYKDLVDSAVALNKWFNLVLHATTLEDGAINYASTRNIWVTSIGNVIKYILQRDRIVFSAYIEGLNSKSFKVRRLAIPSSPMRSFETAFGPGDITTLQIEIDENRIIESVLVDNVENQFKLDIIDNKNVLLTNVRLDTLVNKTVEVKYFDESVPRINLNTNNLKFNSLAFDENPDSQNIYLTSSNVQELKWEIIFDNEKPEWLNVFPFSGNGDGILIVSVSRDSLIDGDYLASFRIIAEDLGEPDTVIVNSPQVVNVSFIVSSPILELSQLYLDFSAIIDELAPVSQFVSIGSNYDSLREISWNSSTNVAWLSATPKNGIAPDIVEITVDPVGLEVGVYNGIVTINSDVAINTPLEININLTIYEIITYHYDFSYPDRDSMLADGWDFMAKHPENIGFRDTEVTEGVSISFDQQLHPGVIRIPLSDGSLWQASNNTQNSLFRDLPAEWISIRLKIAYFNPFDEFQYAGLAAYQDDDNYFQITRDFNIDNHVIFVNELERVTNYVMILENETTDLYFRIDRDILTNVFSAYYSFDGSEWIFVADGIRTLNSPRLGILTGESTYPGSPVADIEWAEVLIATPFMGKKSLRMSNYGITDRITKPSFINPEFTKAVYDISKSIILKINKNYPNPFKTYTTIEYELFEDSNIILELFNSSGEKIETIIQNQYMKAGIYTHVWESRNYPPGIYFLLLRTRSNLDRLKINILQ